MIVATQQGLREKRRLRMKRTIVLLTVATLVLGVLAVGTGVANDENASRAKCSDATLHGTYLFAFDGVAVTGKDQLPLAIAGYDVFDGNGHVKEVASTNFNGQITRKEHVSGTYKVNADCTGTVTYRDGSQVDVFIAPDGSKFTFVIIKPKAVVGTGFEPQGTAKRVGE
jgi:hypothetical protein